MGKMWVCRDAGESSRPKIGGCCAPFRLAEVYLRTKWYPDPSSRYAIIDMCQKWGVIFSIAKNFREAVASM